MEMTPPTFHCRILQVDLRMMMTQIHITLLTIEILQCRVLLQKIYHDFISYTAGSMIKDLPRKGQSVTVLCTIAPRSLRSIMEGN